MGDSESCEDEIGAVRRPDPGLPPGSRADKLPALRYNKNHNPAGISSTGIASGGDARATIHVRGTAVKIQSLLVRQWRNRPGRPLATAASVAVAVGAVVATWVAADASRAGYRRLVQSLGGVPVIDVSARAGGRFDAGTVPGLADIPGVRAAVPLFYRPTLLRVGEQRIREIAVGVDAAGLEASGLLTFEAGTACRGGDEVVLDSSLASGLGLGVGDELLFFSRRGVRRMRISGLVKSESLRWFAEGAAVVVAIDELESMSRAAGLVDRVRLAVDAATDRGRVLTAVQSRLPADLVAEIPAGRAGMADDLLLSANYGLDFVTGLTVAMAWFIVGNAMLMNVTERRRGIALVRLLGATGRQVRRFVTIEAAILGGLGAVVGAAAGLAAARPIAAGISTALQVPAGGITVPPLLVPLAVLLGVVVAIAAAWWPAREATAVDPLDGLATAPAPRPLRAAWKQLVIVIVFLGTVAATTETLVAFGILPQRADVTTAIALLLAFVAVTPFVLLPLVRLLGRLVPRRWRLERRLAVEQIVRQPVRTALTTGVLVVAVSNGIGLGHAIRDSVDDVLGWYGRMLTADWVLSYAGALSVSRDDGSDARAAELAVRALPGVAAVEGLGIATGRAGGASCVVVARDLPDDRPLPLEPVGTTPEAVRAALERGEAVAGTVLARRLNLAAGAEVVVEVFGRTVPVKVAALVVDYTSGGASLHLRRDAARRLFGMESADVLLVTAEPGAAAGLRADLAAIAAKHSLLLRSLGDVRRFIDRIVGGVVGALWMILALGFVVGCLGVANTVTMNVLEQKRSLGLLRAVGMQDGRVVGMVVLQSLLLGAASGIIGLVAGLATALFIQVGSQPLLGHPLRIGFRGDIVAVNLAGAIVVTALAAWLPARRAVRVDLLEAISAE